jgi:hypothetical protein
VPASSPLEGPCGAPRLNAALARLVDLKAALAAAVCGAETRARGPDGSRMRSPQLARCSRDQIRRRMGQHGAALAHVVEAAGVTVRSSERRRAWADRSARSSKRASVPDAEPPPRARWSTHYSPRTYFSLTRRLRRTVAVWPEEPGRGLTPAPTLFYGDRHLLLHGHRTASPGAASLGAATRGATMRL